MFTFNVPTFLSPPERRLHWTSVVLRRKGFICKSKVSFRRDPRSYTRSHVEVSSPLTLVGKPLVHFPLESSSGAPPPLLWT